MARTATLLWTTVGKKIFAALTGLALIGFLISHLIGNLILFHPNPDYYNLYSHKLVSLGPVIWVIELILLAFFLLHIVTGTWVTLTNRAARGRDAYEVTASAGRPSRKSPSSRSMIISGIIIAVFVVVHLLNFKFGDIPETDMMMGGQLVSTLDFHAMTVVAFNKPLLVAFYVFSMIWIFLHLRHGFWSAFQSLGALNPRFTWGVYALGGAIAALLALGYIAIPVYIFFRY